jgi:hypothetical protein
MNGKGDAPRPLSVSQKQFEDNWERIFHSKEKKLEQKRAELQADIDKVRQKLEELTITSQEQGLYDAPSGQAERQGVRYATSA